MGQLIIQPTGSVIVFPPPPTEDYAGLTPTKYVRAGGNNSNDGNTEATAYATIAFAVGKVSAGQVVGVASNVTETLNWGSLVGGGLGSSNHKKIVAKTPGLVISGTSDGSNAASNLTFIDFQWKLGSGGFSAQFAKNIVFIRCGCTEGGGTNSGNVVQWTVGENQAYHGCYADGSGGRYTFLIYGGDPGAPVKNVLFNECVIRTQPNVWGPAGSNPTGGITVYSANQVDLINCVAVDCQNQGNGAEWLGAFNFVSNVGPQAGITVRQCIAKNNTGLIGIQVDGNDPDSVTFLDTCSVKNDYGAVLGTHLKSTSAVNFTGGDYSGNSLANIANFGSAAMTTSGVTTSGSGVIAPRISTYKRYGYGMLRGEAGWNVPTSENVWDAFPNQDLIRDKFSVKSTRGFCSGTNTLTSWVKQ